MRSNYIRRHKIKGYQVNKLHIRSVSDLTLQLRLKCTHGKKNPRHVFVSVQWFKIVIAVNQTNWCDKCQQLKCLGFLVEQVNTLFGMQQNNEENTFTEVLLDCFNNILKLKFQTIILKLSKFTRFHLFSYRSLIVKIYEMFITRNVHLF